MGPDVLCSTERILDKAIKTVNIKAYAYTKIECVRIQSDFSKNRIRVIQMSTLTNTVH